MRLGWRDRLAFWLERHITTSDPYRAVLWSYVGLTTHTRRPIWRNRVNGHEVVR